MIASPRAASTRKWLTWHALNLPGAEIPSSTKEKQTYRALSMSKLPPTQVSISQESWWTKNGPSLNLQWWLLRYAHQWLTRLRCLEFLNWANTNGIKTRFSQTSTVLSCSLSTVFSSSTRPISISWSCLCSSLPLAQQRLSTSVLHSRCKSAQNWSTREKLSSDKSRGSTTWQWASNFSFSLWSD